MKTSPLISRLEKESRKRPARYRLKVVLLAMLGYAYIFLITAMALSSLCWALWQIGQGEFLDALRVGLLSGLLSLLLIPVLWVKIPQPQGRIQAPETAPKLFALIEKIRSKVKGPLIDQVILNDAYNTSIIQIPRLGILGWHRNVLVIGLPMLQSLSRKEFAAVIAHEFGHLSRQHGKLSTWIYRVRTVWAQVHMAFPEERGFGNLLLTRFLRWYIPYFNAYSFVLARRDEYEADRLAAAIVGTRTVADALIAIAVRKQFIEAEFWANLWQRADRHLNPPFMPHGSMRMALQIGLDDKKAQALLDQQLRIDTAFDDTHPCLRERLLALHTPCEMPPESELSAAQVLLEDYLPELQHAFDGLWLQHNSATWRERYYTVQSAQETATRMQERNLQKITPEELSHYGLALETLGRLDEALPLLRQAAEHPNGPRCAALAAARILGQRGSKDQAYYLSLAHTRHAPAQRAA